jgi:hypothetical protein
MLSGGFDVEYMSVHASEVLFGEIDYLGFDP